MDLIALLILGIGLSIDSLAASITTGAYTLQIKINTVLKTALFMAVFQGLMPLIGWLVGSSFKSIIEAYDHWVAFALLFAIGGKMVYEGIQKRDEVGTESKSTSNLMLAGMAFATSIDALIVGIGFGLMSVNIWLAVFIIGVTTFLFSAVGVVLGNKVGTRINKSIEILGGVILIGLGLKILITHIYV